MRKLIILTIFIFQLIINPINSHENANETQTTNSEIQSLTNQKINSETNLIKNSSDIFRDGSLIFSWKIDSTSKKITFNIDAETTGWVGLGFSPDGTMKNADMIMCYMSNSTPNCSDRYSKGHGVPQLDTVLNEKSKDDVEKVSGELKNNRSIYSFNRDLDTNDNMDYQIKEGEEINVIFCYRKDGSPDNEKGVFNMHTKIGGEKIVLFSQINETVEKSVKTYKAQLKFDSYITFILMMFIFSIIL